MFKACPELVEWVQGNGPGIGISKFRGYEKNRKDLALTLILS
jgi:hypothetical protein